MSNAVAKRPKFSVALQTDGYQKLINNTLRDPKRAQQFIASLSSAVANNPALQDCDHGTILTGALLGEGLNLSPSPQLGQYYLVPFEDRKNQRKVATFILGYKGYIQLAARSGQYKTINVVSVKKGELAKYNPFTEEIDFTPIEDALERETAETVGYYAFFEYLNGFRKSLFWSKDKMERHASQYSKGYAAKKGYTFWEKDFDGMAHKTMLRQLISKWGVMSIEMQWAIEGDGAVITEGGEPEYFTAEGSSDEEARDELPETPAAPAAQDAEQQAVSLGDL